MKHRKDKAKREAEIASVLVHQHKQISSIRFQSPESLRNQIDSSQELLQRSGYVVVLNNGSIEACGTHTELMKSCKTYQDIYHSHVGNEGENNE